MSETLTKIKKRLRCVFYGHRYEFEMTPAPLSVSCTRCGKRLHNNDKMVSIG